MTVTSPLLVSAVDPVQARVALTRALRPDSAPHQRFLLLQGGPGSGKTRALAAVAADARAEGLDVVELHAGDGELGVTSGSLDSLVSLLHGDATSWAGATADAPDRPRILLIDDFDRLAPAARERVRAMVTRYSGGARGACVVTVVDGDLGAAWAASPRVVLDGGSAEAALDRWARAQQRLQDGQPHQALALLLRSADLLPAASDRRRARESALSVAAFLGEFATADRLLTGAEAPSGPVVVAITAWMRAVRSGQVREASRLVREALAARPVDGHEADLLVGVLQMLGFLGGGDDAWDAAVRAGAGRDLDPVLRVVEDCLEPSRAEAPERLYRAARASLDGGEPWKLVSLHVAWSLLDPLDARRPHLDALLAAQREDRMLPGIMATCRRAMSGFQAGRLDEALQDLDRARVAATELDAGIFVALLDASAALIHAVRGDDDEVGRTAGSAHRWALRHSAPSVARGADKAHASLDLASGRYEEAYTRMAADRRIGSRWLQPGSGPIELLDAVEATARLRLPARGRELVAAAERAAGSSPSPRQALVLAAAHAVLDEDGATRERFETALRAVDATDAPFETARVHLAYGEWLRRDMCALDARLHLRLAATTFESLGAERWSLRARQELRAAGGADGANRRSDDVDLSEQELRVASLAAAGLSNKQIASRLYLSPRTVSGHLYRIFPKLGVTSRAGLRDALSAVQDEPRPTP